MILQFSINIPCRRHLLKAQILRVASEEIIFLHILLPRLDIDNHYYE